MQYVVHCGKDWCVMWWWQMWCGMVWCDVECVGRVCMMWDVVHFLPPPHNTTYCTPLLHTSTCNVAMMYNYVAVMCSMWCIVAKIGAWCVIWWWQMWCEMVWYEMCDVECVGTVCMMWDGTKRNVVWWDVKYGSITLHISSHNTHSTCTIPHHTNPFHISPPQLIYHTFHQIPHHTFHTTTVLCDEMWNVVVECVSNTFHIITQHSNITYYTTFHITPHGGNIPYHTLHLIAPYYNIVPQFILHHHSTFHISHNSSSHWTITYCTSVAFDITQAAFHITTRWW